MAQRNLVARVADLILYAEESCSREDACLRWCKEDGLEVRAAAIARTSIGLCWRFRAFQPGRWR
jgi:hypothetical protein